MKVLMALLIILVIGGCAVKQPATPEQPQVPVAKPTVYLEAQGPAVVGQPFKVDIKVKNMPMVAGAQVSVAYDAQALAYDRSEEGTFFNKDVATLYFDIKETSKPGLIKDIVVVRQSGDTTGDGLVASMYFTPLKAGDTRIDFGEVLVTNSSTDKQVFSLEGIAVKIS